MQIDERDPSKQYGDWNRAFLQFIMCRFKTVFSKVTSKTLVMSSTACATSGFLTLKKSDEKETKAKKARSAKKGASGTQKSSDFVSYSCYVRTVV